MKATVIVPTTGAKTTIQAAQSIITQKPYSVRTYVVEDGHPAKLAFWDARIEANLPTTWTGSDYYQTTLPLNVGANGFYGHRIYAAFTHLINTEYVLYLDQDCWFEPNHVESCINTIEEKGLDWCYSLRKICDVAGNYLLDDNCESIGKWPAYTGSHLVDTNCYCIKTSVAIKLAQVWHGGWGQDRVFMNAMMTHFPKFDCTGEYTVNYRLAGNEGSVTKEFFENGNKIMNERYEGKFPWVKV